MARLDQFVANLVRSGLLDRPAEAIAPAPRWPTGPDSDAAVRLARHLIGIKGRLTSYQARKVLAGAVRGFFLGEYRILRALGEGGMGKVYLAAHREDGRRVAIKVFPPGKAKEGGQALLRFRREMDLSRRAVHPNLARTLDVGQDWQRPLHDPRIRPGREPLPPGQGHPPRGAAPGPRRRAVLPQGSRRIGGGPRCRRGPSRHQAVEPDGHARRRRPHPRPRPGPRDRRGKAPDPRTTS